MNFLTYLIKLVKANPNDRVLLLELEAKRLKKELTKDGVDFDLIKFERRN